MGNKAKTWVGFFLYSFLVLLVFKAWFFSFSPLSSGDWSYLFSENIADFSWPFVVRPGGYPPLDFFFQASTKVLSASGLSWPLIERLVWFWPFLLLTVFSAWFLAKSLFPKKKLVQFLAPLIYLFNTYSLMLVGGGQMGVAMAYALTPLVLALLVRSVSRPSQAFLTGLVLAIQVMFDPRLALLTLGVGALLLINFRLSLRKWWLKFFLPAIIALGAHLPWLAPLLLKGDSILPSGYGGSGWPEFLSFADFSNSFSLLHPNWPENIFGKVYFMRPEFLILPILAFSSLLFLNKSQAKKSTQLPILSFALVGLLGAFLAKGTRPPFGGLYLWLFEHLPGMSLFRDPTKFYLLVALSYSILIPFTLSQVSQFKKRPVSKHRLSVIIFVFFYLFTLRPAWQGELTGTFKLKKVPPEYFAFKEFLSAQPEFFRTFWLPQKQRFGFESQNHPAIEGKELLAQQELLAQKVKYVVIPLDSEEEIFLEDRKYESRVRDSFEAKVAKSDWLRKLEEFREIGVYEVVTN